MCGLAVMLTIPTRTTSKNIDKIQFFFSDWVPSEEDLQKIIDLVLCACDDGDYDHQLSLDEYTSPVCEVKLISCFYFQYCF